MEISRGYAFVSQGCLLMRIVKANILIDEAQHALLTDFGLLTIIPDATSLISSASFTQGGTHRWMSPELFDPENFSLKDGRPTKLSDCHALGMLIYEVLSGKIPFSQHHGYAVIVRPQGAHRIWFTNEVWDTLEHCWDPIPGDRPRIKDTTVSGERFEVLDATYQRYPQRDLTQTTVSS